MMIEQHYDEKLLIEILESDRISSDEHLPGCADCSEKLESFRMIADALREEDVWNAEPLPEAPVASTIATLRAFADRMADDDARAEIWLTDLLAGSRETWRARLAQHPEYRTAGMVRKLIVASDRAIDTMPPDAVEMTNLATDIADHLDPSEHPADTVARLRGAAWRDRAFALFYTGQNADARRAAQIAADHFSRCAVGTYDRARVAIVTALVERSLDNTDLALDQSRRSAGVFAAFGDRERYASASTAEAAALAQAGRFEEALKIFLDLESQFSQDDASDAHGRVLANIAFAYRNLGKAEDAITFFTASAEIFEALGTRSEAVRIRWNLANVLAANGRWDDAGVRLAAVREEFRELGLFGAAAVAALDLAEVRLVQSRQSEVPALCVEATEYFSAAGIGYTARALRAVAYMREAAETGRATPELARTVRDYIRRLPAEPALLFLPPNDDRG